MRVFTNEEKELLRRIEDGRGRNLYNLIDPWINGVSFIVNKLNTQTASVTFNFENTPGLDIISRLKEIQTILIQSVNLIKLFEDKGYIFTYVNSNQLPNPFVFGQAAINIPSITHQFTDPRISNMFAEYATREIFITPELNKFITDGFITREEVRANRQYRTARIALYVAITALVLNLSFNIYHEVKSVYKNETKDVPTTNRDTVDKKTIYFEPNHLDNNIKTDTFPNDSNKSAKQ